MKTHASRVRTCFVLTGLGLACAAAGCSDINNPARPTAAPGATAAVAPSDSLVTAGFDVGPELAQVRRATAQFHDISAAYAVGYTTEHEPCVSSPAGVMGVHAPNFALLGDQAIDPLRPELLLYEPTREGGFKLAGVEYFQVVLLRNRETQAVGPRFDSTPWDPAQFEVVNAAPQLFGESFHLAPPPVPTVPWHWSLHAWIWTPNPAGIFSDWNPSLRCE